MGSLVVHTAPTVEPISVTDAIRQLRIAEPGGEPKPGAPAVALAGAGAGSVDNGAHHYRVTFVTADGETDAGDASDVVTVADKTVNGQVSVTGIPIGGPLVTSRKLYRTKAGLDTYYFVATIANNTATTYTDNIADSGLGAGAPSTNTTDDSYIRSLISAARQRVENDTGRALCTQVWDLILDHFPLDGGPINVPLPPVQTIDSITYTDVNGSPQTLSTSVYVTDITDAYCKISLKWAQVWPVTLIQAAVVTIRFTTGYGVASAVPAGLKAAVRLALMDLYISPNPAGAALTTMPQETFDRVLSPYVVRRVA